MEKVVRIQITDGRDYVGRLMSVDKTKSIFLQDALEVIDRSIRAEEECKFLHHDLFTSYLLGATDKPAADAGKAPPDVVMKYVGNVVIPGKHVLSIKLDHRLQKEYEAAELKLRQEQPVPHHIKY